MPTPPAQRSFRSIARGLARLVPVLSRYERLLAGAHEHINSLTDHIERIEARLHIAEHVIAGAEPQQISKLNRNAPLWQSAGHFYSPIVDVQQIAERADRVFDREPLPIPGIESNLEAQWRTFDALVPFMADLALCDTPEQAAEQNRRYYVNNPAYADGDASLLAGMLRLLRPQRLIELGCGYSSACTLDTRDQYLDGTPHITFVDPYPQLLEDLLRPSDRNTVDILSVGTQDVPLELIDTLNAGDVLFIDSTHVSKTGSDVNHIFSDILPRLQPGVVVHLHDIFAGFEYPRAWVEEGRSWNELYMLRTFLQFNAAFEILLFPSMLQAVDRDRYIGGLPGLRNPGGAFWMRRR